jgi:hypothetical protein
MKIKYKDASDYKYQLLEKWSVKTPIVNAAARITDFIELAQDGTLTIHEGYAWDGASGPTIDTKSSMRASLAHDALYQLERAGHLGQEWRDAADKLLHDLCVADGMWPWRAKAWLWGVRTFAAYAAKRKAEQVMVAP